MLVPRYSELPPSQPALSTSVLNFATEQPMFQNQQQMILNQNNDCQLKPSKIYK